MKITKMKTKDWDTLFPHFTPEEYFSPGGMEIFNRNIMPSDPLLVHCVESFRTHLNSKKDCDKEVTLVINHGDHKLRGFVTPEEWCTQRPKREGQLYSYHLWCAADISSPEVDSEELFKQACKARAFHGFLLFNGIIGYSWGVHVDMRRSEQYIKQY